VNEGTKLAKVLRALETFHPNLKKENPALETIYRMVQDDYDSADDEGSDHEPPSARKARFAPDPVDHVFEIDLTNQDIIAVDDFDINRPSTWKHARPTAAAVPLSNEPIVPEAEKRKESRPMNLMSLSPMPPTPPPLTPVSPRALPTPVPSTLMPPMPVPSSSNSLDVEFLATASRNCSPPLLNNPPSLRLPVAIPCVPPCSKIRHTPRIDSTYTPFSRTRKYLTGYETSTGAKLPPVFGPTDDEVDDILKNIPGNPYSIRQIHLMMKQMLQMLMPELDTSDEVLDKMIVHLYYLRIYLANPESLAIQRKMKELFKHTIVQCKVF